MISSRKFFYLAPAFALLMLTANASAAGEPRIQDGPSKAVETWANAVRKGDSAALARMHTAATVAYPSDAMIRRGSQEIMPGYVGMFEKFDVEVKIADSHFIESEGLLHSWGLYTLTLKSKSPVAGSEPIVIEGRFSDIAKKSGDQWQYIFDHASKPSN